VIRVLTATSTYWERAMSVHERIWSWRKMRFVCGRCGFGWALGRRRCVDEPLRLAFGNGRVYATGVPQDSPLKHWPINLDRSHTSSARERQ
jgi:hypothetical protein